MNNISTLFKIELYKLSNFPDYHPKILSEELKKIRNKLANIKLANIKLIEIFSSNAKLIDISEYDENCENLHSIQGDPYEQLEYLRQHINNLKKFSVDIFTDLNSADVEGILDILKCLLDDQQKFQTKWDELLDTKAIGSFENSEPFENIQKLYIWIHELSEGKDRLKFWEREHVISDFTAKAQAKLTIVYKILDFLKAWYQKNKNSSDDDKQLGYQRSIDQLGDVLFKKELTMTALLVARNNTGIKLPFHLSLWQGHETSLPEWFKSSGNEPKLYIFFGHPTVKEDMRRAVEQGVNMAWKDFQDDRNANFEGFIFVRFPLHPDYRLEELSGKSITAATYILAYLQLKYSDKHGTIDSFITEFSHYIAATGGAPEEPMVGGLPEKMSSVYDDLKLKKIRYLLIPHKNKSQDETKIRKNLKQFYHHAYWFQDYADVRATIENAFNHYKDEKRFKYQPFRGLFSPPDIYQKKEKEQFVGHNLEELGKRIKKDNIVLWYGYPGIGKTQAALQYFWQYGTNNNLFPDGVVWLDGSDTPSFENDLINTLKACFPQYETEHLSRKDLLKIIYNKIHNLGGLLIIIDNFDLHHSEEIPPIFYKIEKMVKRNNVEENPAILLTSRSDLSSQVYAEPNISWLNDINKIMIDKLTMDNGITMLKHGLKRNDLSLSNLFVLLKILDGHPLSIELFRFYLNGRGKNESFESLIILLEEEGTAYYPLHIFQNLINAIVDSIAENSLTALKALVIFHHENFSATLWAKVIDINVSDQYNIIDLLIDAGIVYQGENGVFHTHAMIQEAIRNILSYDISHVNQLRNILKDKFENNSLLLLEDIKHLERADSIISDKHISTLLNCQIGGAYKSLELFDRAEKALKHALDLASENDAVDLGWVDILNQLGMVLYEQKKYEKAIYFLEKYKVIIQKKALHPSLIAANYNQRGLVYQRLGNNEKALHCFKKALILYENNRNICDSAIVYQNLGVLYNDGLKDHEKAIFYSEKAYNLFIGCGLNEFHPRMERILYNLWNFNNNKGQQLDAINFGKKFLENRSKNFGKTGIDIYNVNFSIGSVYFHQKEYELAIEYFKEAFSIPTEITQKSIICYEGICEFIDCYIQLNQLESLIDFLESSIDKQSRWYKNALLLAALGHSYIQLANNVFTEENEYIVEGIDCFHRSLEIFEHLMIKSVDVAVISYELGNTLLKINNIQNALLFLKKAVSYYDIIDEEIFKGEFLYALGLAYYKDQKYDQAIQYYQKALNQVRKSNPDNLRLIALITNNLGSSYAFINNFQEALEYFKEAEKIILKDSSNSDDVLLKVQEHIKGCQDYIRLGRNISFKSKQNNPKIGRNDLCSCGSGKKYKKCCLNRS